MKVDKQFIKVYNETFRFINKIGGIECLVEYFKRIWPFLLFDLEDAVKRQGLTGAMIYWMKTLKAEGAKFDINVDDDTGLRLHIKQCPSINSLDDPCKEYCRHCGVMYKELFEKHGYKFNHTKRGPASCEIKIKEL